MVRLVAITAKDMPCEFDFVISRGRTLAAQSVFVTLAAEQDGRIFHGYGEAVPCAYYGHTPETLTEFLSWVQSEKLLEPLTPFDIQWFHDTMQRVSGHQPPKAALEMALLDLQGKILGQPVYRLWGLDPARVPPSSYTIGLAEPDVVEQKVKTALSRNYSILKVKVGGEADLQTLSLIRKLVPAETRIRVDANAAWTADQAIEMLGRLSEFDVEFVEEPLQMEVSPKDRLRVKAASPLPLMADETVHTLADVPVVAPWVHAVNLKLPKTGGLWEAMRMIHAARAHHLEIMLGCFAESSLSITAFAQLAPLVDYLDLDGGLLLKDDPVEGVRWEGSRMMLPEGPGLGCRFKDDAFLAEGA